MRLTLLSDYSLRVLMFLAVKNGELATITEISKSYDISRNHLTKVVHQLGRANYIETTRGRSGGVRLAKSCNEISVGKIIRLMEETSVLVECFPGGKGGCKIVSACKLKSALAAAQEAFFKHLDGITLQDLTTQPASIKELLDLSSLEQTS